MAQEPPGVDALRDRPSIEAEVARLTEARDAVAEALGSRLGLDGWGVLDEGSTAGCADAPDAGGQTVFLPALLREGGVPDEAWDRAVEVVAEVAGAEGFGAPETVVDSPGQHQVVLRGERESLLRFSTLQRATLELETGCHLPAGS